jgi:hypothetical protein
VPWRPELAGRIERSISLLDVAPTILDAFGLPAPPSFEGKPITPTGARPSEEVPIYSDAPKYDSVAVTMGKQKLIFRPDHPFFSWLDGSPLPPAAVPLECFDLVADPEECHPHDCSNDWGRRLQLELQRYIADSYPHSLLVRVPRSLSGLETSSYLVRARAAELRASAYGAAPKEEPRVSAGWAESRLEGGSVPVWIAFHPRGDRSLDLQIGAAQPARSAGGQVLGDETQLSWTDLLWRGETLLPEGLVVFSTPPGSSAAVGQEVQYTEELVARLRALGYLTAGTQAAEPLRGSAEPESQSLEVRDGGKAGMIRIRRIRR